MSPAMSRQISHSVLALLKLAPIGRGSGINDPRPAVTRDALLLRAGANRLRELVAPLERPAGIDDYPAVVALDVWPDRRIQRPAPGAFDDVERALRIRPRAHSPHHLVEVRHVDVLVHHDHDPAQVGPRPAHG